MRTTFHKPQFFWAGGRNLTNISKSSHGATALQVNEKMCCEPTLKTCCGCRGYLCEMKLVFLLICISFKTLQLESYSNSPLFCRQHFALQLPAFSQRFLRRGYPSQAHSTNQFCFLAFHQQHKKSTFNICYTCPSSLNCSIHEFLNRPCISLSMNNQ